MTGRETADRTWLRALILVDQLLTIAILLAGVAAVIMLLGRRIKIGELWLLVSSVAYLVVISGGHEAYSRFRVPVTPLVAVVGATAVMSWRSSRNSR